MTSKSQFSSCLISFHGGLLLKVPRPPGNWAWASRGLMLEYVWNTWGMCKFMKIKGLTSHDNLGKKSFNYSWTVWLWDWNLLIEICSSNDSSQSLLSASQFWPGTKTVGRGAANQQSQCCEFHWILSWQAFRTALVRMELEQLEEEVQVQVGIFGGWHIRTCCCTSCPIPAWG